ncbi:MAG TPA: Asp-tRNA(Asn)/Glu-tRNA(Gln) amidotransferase subunit GatB [Planctomycetota bacterium]|nr:Asp-tRNA(Asn)/Glu-tRNA(Gln) amidotransferase subunit GatB [Planctomycetota bacterium]
MDYEPVIGIETHVQLETDSKLFCGCSTTFGAAPNSQVCPVCLGLPGCLPVVNRRAVELGMRAALALNCTIARRTKFDRKHYFYPDLPKNYQISQYDLPLATDGFLQVDGRRVGIERVHMEEDAGKLMHEEGGDRSYVDLNRAGMPLIEIVTRPDLRGPDEASAYMTSLKSTLRYLAISNCDMEKGEFRCDVNLSIRPRGSTQLGTKTEIKNLNSFRFAADAIRYEFDRQVRALSSGERIVQETRSWDTEKKVTVAMRSKEEVHDYRYFPEPDLPQLSIEAAEVERVRGELPELAPARKERFVRDYALSDYDAGVLVAERAIADYFEEAARLSGNAKTAANWVINEVLKVLNERKLEARDFKVRPAELAALIGMVEARRVTSLSAKDALAAMAQSGKSAAQTVKEMGLEVVTDSGALEAAVDQVIAANPKAVADYKGGKETTEKFLIGQVMRLTRGRADVSVVTELFRKRLR